MKTLAVYSIKGGVGKTATAVNLAYLAAQGGLRTLLWDLDPQGAATFYFRVKARLKGGAETLVRKKSPLEGAIRASNTPGLDILPADFSLRDLDLVLDTFSGAKKRLPKRIGVLEHEYDLIMIDCAPSISLVSENVFRAADALLLPLIPTPLSLRTHAKLIKHLRKSELDNLTLLPFFSMVDSRRNMHKDIVAEWVARGQALPHSIPYSTQVESMGTHRETVLEIAPKSPAANAYRALWSAVLARVF